MNGEVREMYASSCQEMGQFSVCLFSYVCCGNCLKMFLTTGIFVSNRRGVIFPCMVQVTDKIVISNYALWNYNSYVIIKF